MNNEIEALDKDSICDIYRIIVIILYKIAKDEKYKDRLGVPAETIDILIEKLTSKQLMLVYDINMSYKEFAYKNGICEDADEFGLTAKLCEKYSRTIYTKFSRV